MVVVGAGYTGTRATRSVERVYSVSLHACVRMPRALRNVERKHVMHAGADMHES